MFDIIIRNAFIVDGTGNPGYKGDLAVEKDRIVAIGRLPDAQAELVIDATGKVLCPGFIDVHLHSEVEMLAGRHIAGIQMGVTTELICPDGMSFAPLPPDLLADYRRYTFGIYGDADIGWDWHTLEDYLERFRGRIRNNVVLQIPHSVVRLAAKGWADGPATPDEMAIMSRLVREFMEAGAVSLNTGLGYVPAAYADVHEIIQLCKIVAEYGGIYAAHMRSYGADIEAAIAETVAIAEGAEIPVHISHFRGTPTEYASAEAARARGIDITWDAYPYMAGCTLLSYGLPIAMWAKGIDAILEDLCQPSVRTWLQPHLESFFPLDSPAYFAFVSRSHNKWMEGKRVRDVWRQSGKSFVDFYCDLLIDEDLAPSLIYPWTDTPEIKNLRLRTTLTHPLQMVSTDGIYVGNATHPRGYGTYARILGRYVRDEKWLRLEDAIRRMTSFPAARFGLRDRGLLHEGMAADLVVFDPQSVIDRATYEEPRLPPVGFEHVFVNGVPVIKNGTLTDNHPGRLLPRG